MEQWACSLLAVSYNLLFFFKFQGGVKRDLVVSIAVNNEVLICQFKQVIAR